MSYTMIGAISHVIGVYFTKLTGLTDILLVSIIGICISVIAGIIHKRVNIALIIAMFMLSVGGISYSIASNNRLYETFPDKYVTVTGTIISSPTKSSGEYCNKYILKPQSVSYLGSAVKTHQRLYVRTRVPYNYGDIIEVSGFLTELTGGDNEYDFDYSYSFKSKGIYNQISAMETRKIGEINPYNPKYWIGGIKNFIHQTIFHNYGGEIAAVYNAILLGDKSYFSDSYTVKLLKTGVWQALYSPYIHIILLTLLAGLFHTSKKKNRVLLALLLVYAIFNSGSPNLLKASLLIASVIAYRQFFGYSDKMQQLSLLVLVLTIINPMICYHRGFILSVASTIVLFVFYPAVYELLLQGFRKIHIQSGKPASVLSIAIVLCLFTLPLTAYLFNGTATYSTLIASMLVPVIFLIILLSLVYIPILNLLPSGGFLEPVMDKLLRAVEKLPSRIENIPGHYIEARTPTILQIITAYLIFWLIIQLIKKRKRDEIFKAVSAVALSFLLCACFFGQHPGLEIYFVNVGQGDSAILNTSLGETVLIDGGGAAEYDDSDYNVGNEVLMPYMLSHGFSTVDYAIVTHFHKDHAQGIISAIENLKVKNLVMPDTLAGGEYRLFLEILARKKGVNIIYAQKDGMISLKSGLTIRFLAPDSSQLQSKEPNDTTIVAQVDYYGFCGLFTGDSTDTADSSYPKYIDLLKVAHHGSSSSSSESDINYLCPKYAVISVGKNNSYGLPDDTVLDNLENVNAKILRTDVCGDIRFKINKNGIISYKTLREE